MSHYSHVVSPWGANYNLRHMLERNNIIAPLHIHFIVVLNIRFLHKVTFIWIEFLSQELNIPLDIELKQI